MAKNVTSLGHEGGEQFFLGGGYFKSTHVQHIFPGEGEKFSTPLPLSYGPVYGFHMVRNMSGKSCVVGVNYSGPDILPG